MPKRIVKLTGVPGAFVLGVIKNSPAEEAGLAYKDVITKIDNVNVFSDLDLEFYL
ncbi:MAG: PDZ domain-containing protein [Spirochaetes bacterium]|nr:PDZ domain-containing protein [Spirochaetota bacterium]